MYGFPFNAGKITWKSHWPIGRFPKLSGQMLLKYRQVGSPGGSETTDFLRGKFKTSIACTGGSLNRWYVIKKNIIQLGSSIPLYISLILATYHLIKGSRKLHWLPFQLGGPISPLGSESRYADGKVQKRKVRETWQAQQPEHCSHDLEKSGWQRLKPGGLSKPTKTWLVVEPIHLKNMLVKLGIFPK